MGLSFGPRATIEVNGTIIETGIIHVTLVDEEGLMCDTASVTIAEKSGKIAVPKLGVKVNIIVEYDDKKSKFGAYYIDECEIASDGTLALQCKSIDFRETLRGVKTRSFPSGRGSHGVTLKEIAETIAREYSMKAACDAFAQQVFFEHVHQRNETDLHLLTRLANDRGCTLKIREGVICLLVKDGTSVSGKDLPVVSVAVGRNVISWRYALRKSIEYTAVTAVWREYRKSVDHVEKAGSGDQIYAIPTRFYSAKEAKASAEAKLKSLRAGVESLELEVHGSVDMRSERIADVKGIRSAVDGSWVIKRAEHKIMREGYTVSLRCERPREDEENKS